MSVAPPKKLAACLAAIECALVRLRVLGWSSERGELEQAGAAEIASLADAVHNLPYLIQHWDRCDESLLRAMLQDCDHRFPGSRNLLDVYDTAERDAGQHGH